VQLNSYNKYYSNKIVVLDKANRTIFLGFWVDGLLKINPIELFNLLIYKKDLPSFRYKELIIDKEVLELKLIKSLNDVVFHVEFAEDHASIDCYLSSLILSRPISECDVRYIIENKYLIKDNELIPISSDSIKFAEELFNVLNNENKLSILDALELYSKRERIKYIEFIDKNWSINRIIESGLYSSTSSLFIRDLYDYQLDGLKWLQYCCLNGIGGILGDDMGLGKTAQIIALVSWLIEKDIIDNVLIIVPSTLLENWRREFDFFAPSIVPYLHHGELRTGSIRLLSSKRVVITSYSMIVNDQYLFNKIQWGTVILDEASLIKNPNSERKLSLSSINSKVRIAMTGTPVENSLIDLWSICDFVLPGYLGSIDEFTKKYVKKNLEQIISDSDLTELKKDISFVMLRRKKEDVLDSLPDRIDIHQALQMNYHEGLLYNDLRESILSDMNNMNSENILTLIQNLRQFTTHPLLLTNELGETADLASLRSGSAKFQRTLEILDEIKSRREKVLIFTEYLQMIDSFKKVLNELYSIEVFTIDGRISVAERQATIDCFSSFKGFAVMILNPRTAGMGLNITAANHVIHYTRQWNPALEEQASARSYRNKQDRKVNIYYLYYVDSIEEIIDTRLRIKKQLSGEVITTTDNDLTMSEYINALSKTPIHK
jgi:SNF2 family DNA or RNA helicase